MAVLMELEIPLTVEQYDAVENAVDARSNPPEGFIAHSAQDLGDRMHIRDLWESAEAFGAFAESRLAPAINQALGDDAPPSPEPRLTELHNAYGNSA
ncbi:MAG TPA: hypothetical protein VLB79_09885 [Solirubrobacterales bacterium]|nr:hypothetical protein [Solirubrobacterales bacterium]